MIEPFFTHHRQTVQGNPPQVEAAQDSMGVIQQIVKRRAIEVNDYCGAQGFTIADRCT